MNVTTWTIPLQFFFLATHDRILALTMPKAQDTPHHTTCQVPTFLNSNGDRHSYTTSKSQFAPKGKAVLPLSPLDLHPGWAPRGWSPRRPSNAEDPTPVLFLSCPPPGPQPPISSASLSSPTATSPKRNGCPCSTDIRSRAPGPKLLLLPVLGPRPSAATWPLRPAGFISPCCPRFAAFAPWRRRGCCRCRSCYAAMFAVSLPPSLVRPISRQRRAQPACSTRPPSCQGCRTCIARSYFIGRLHCIVRLSSVLSGGRALFSWSCRASILRDIWFRLACLRFGFVVL